FEKGLELWISLQDSEDSLSQAGPVALSNPDPQSEEDYKVVMLEVNDCTPPTQTPTSTATSTATATNTATPTETATNSPTNTATPTSTAIPTDTSTPTLTPTSTAEPTSTPTLTTTPMAEPSATSTSPAATEAATPAPTMTETPDAPAAAPLDNGSEQPDQTGSAGSTQRFTLDVPADARNLRIEISGGTGNADLIVKSGSEPTLTDFDCRPQLATNNEVCEFETPDEGTYYIMLYGEEPFAGVTLRVDYLLFDKRNYLPMVVR
ncbi:MAG: PPC domain-containing protein, partial [Chloroflexota bacterium]